MSLNREALLGLRRERGLSQELLAMMCAEQRLCVSIASIKRAETGKNILYRTARDIAQFFEIDLGQIVNGDEVNAAARVDPDDAVVIPAHRKVAVLWATLCAPAAATRSGGSDYWVSACKLAASRCDAEFHGLGDTDAAFLFGRLSLMGYEPFQAYSCHRWLRGQVRSLMGENCSLASRIFYLDLPTGAAEAGLTSDELAAMLAARWHDDGTAMAEANLVLVDDYAKEALQSRFQLSPCADEKHAGWRLHEDRQSEPEVKQFIGRDLQCQQFRAASESAYAYRELQLIYVRGMAGIGKTRLLEEFCDLAEGLGIEHHKTQVLDFGSERIHQAIPRLLRSILQLGDDERDLSMAELESRFGQAVCEPSELLFLQSWLNWSLDSESLALYNAMDHDTRSAGLRGVAANLVRKATINGPLLLCLEDLHWASDDLLDGIEQLAESIQDCPVILLMTSRQENDPLQYRWASAWSHLPMLVMNLAPLRDAEAGMFANYFTDVSEEYKRQCIERAEGNPLFLEQLLRFADHRGEQLPYSVQTLVQTRLDGLDAHSQSVARAASVLGQWFTEPALQNLLGSQPLKVEPLIEHHLIKRSSERLLFVHALVQQGVYQTITEEARIDLHRQCARWFEEVDSALRARHLARARDPAAAEAYLHAVREKIDQHAFDEALLLVDEAGSIDFAEIDRSTMSRLHGEAMQGRGDTESAIRCFRDALEQASTPSQKFAALVSLAIALDTQENFDEALAALADAEACLDGNDNDLELSQTHYLRGNLYFPRGLVDECRQQHQIALDHARRARDPHAEARALGGLGDAAYAKGSMLTALEYFENCLEICRAHGFSRVEAANRFMLGTTRIYRNDTDQALADALESAELSARIGHKRAEIVSRLTAGWILLDRLDLAAAESQIDQGLKLARDIGARRFEPFLQESQARLYFYRGDRQRATSLLAEARDEVYRQEIEEFIGPWVIGSYALVLGSDERARDLLDEGARMLRRDCIGHNYYRFYVSAIECALLNRSAEALQDYCEALRGYTADEPTPWSDFYLRRAVAIAASWATPATGDLVDTLRGLALEAETAGLQHALPLLVDAVERLAISAKASSDPGGGADRPG